MNTRELQTRLRGRARTENDAKAANSKVDVAKGVIAVSWFVALGRFCSVVAEFFRVNGQYLFLLSLLLNYVTWVISAMEYDSAGNKNLGKTVNFLYGTFYILFYIGIAVGFVVGGMLLGGSMLLASMFFDPIVNLGRAIYFGIKSALTATDDPQKRYFFKCRALNHGAFALFGGLVSVAFTLLMLPLSLSFAATVAIGIVGIGVMALAVFVVPKVISWLMGPEPEVIGPLVASDDEEMALLSQAQVSPSYYYDNTLTTKPTSLDELLSDINAYIIKIEGDYSRDEKTFLESIWSQNDKRLNKISALEFLKGIINDAALAAIPDEATEQQRFQLAGYLFHYKDKIELCEKISALVLEKFPGAFQSSFKEIGDTEACFNKLFLCIIENDELLSRGVSKKREDDELVYSLRGALHAV